MSARIIVTITVALASCSGSSREAVVSPPGPPPPEPRIRVTAEVAADWGAPKDRLELTFVGDIMFGGWFHDRFRHVPAVEHDPLAAVDALLASDLAIANLETPVVEEIPAELTGHLRFAATPDQLALLPHHGIWAVTVANNHANDLGDAGILETPGHLDALGIVAAGAGRQELPPIRVETIEAAGWRIGLIAATLKLNQKSGLAMERIPWMRAPELVERLAPVIAAARVEHELVLVAIHWGDELADHPAPWQVRAAHALIDAGASAVIGHHPHVLQGIERYGGGLIAYSLGNFVFRSIEDPQRFTGVLRLAFVRNSRCLAQASFHPAVMRGGLVAHPVPAEGVSFDQVAARLTRLSASAPLDRTTWSVDGERLVTDGACP